MKININKKGETVVKQDDDKKTYPLPVSKLVETAFPSTVSKTYSYDAKLHQRFELLAASLEDEAEMKRGTWLNVLKDLADTLNENPENLTILTDDAVELFFKCSGNFSTITEIRGKRASDTVQLNFAELDDSSDDFDLLS